jgi:hypothetical protein
LVRCLDATSEPAGKIQVKGRDIPVVQYPSETQLTINPLGSSDTDVPMQGASTSSIPAEGWSGQPVSGAGGFCPARKALSGAARRKLKKSKAEVSVARTGGTQKPGHALASERRNIHWDS